ncbi:MAG: Pre protein translocase subunit Sec66-domain-containing protein [Benniella sp.]|nr:MAG: Pre protein translocase subunit Sec66-domain-containing protein [Benniella sp.]
MVGSVWLAAIYIGGWIVAMRIFGFFWKRRQIVIKDAQSWFPENEARANYIALLQQTEPEASEAQLKAALMRRAMEVVKRILSMREDKPLLSGLVKQGVIDDDTWLEFTASEKELEYEIREIMEEADTFKEGWGHTILQSASEMVMHERAKVTEKEEAVRKQEEEKNKIKAGKDAEKRKEREREQALKELLDEEAAEQKKASAAAKKKKKGKK